MERKSCCSGMRSCGSSNTRVKPTMTIKKEEDVKPLVKKEVVHQPNSCVKTEAKNVKMEEKVATSVKKEEVVKFNVGCGGGGGCSSFK